MVDSATRVTSLRREIAVGMSVVERFGFGFGFEVRGEGVPIGKRQPCFEKEETTGGCSKRVDHQPN